MLTENQLFANRYRLVKRLGQGAFSEVWKAEDTKAGNLTVALKVYAPDKGLDEDGAKVFSDEFAIVFNVHHSNLLTPNYFDEENNSPYLVLPFCEQGSALKLVGKMGERQVAQFLHDVASALAYLHESEIVHQDIKPDNVLIDAKGNFLVTDFGISTRIRSTLRKSVGDKKSSGTMAYMGPERFSKTPHAIKASDVWSLGATVYELMTGDVPFGDMGGGMQKGGADIPNVEGDYSPGLKLLVDRCLAKETWDRPTAAQLRDICDGYLRTGAWDLSSLNKSSTQEPEKPRKAAGRPTERKVFAPESDQTAKEKPTKEIPLKPEPEKLEPTGEKVPNPARRKRLPWIIGGGVVLLMIIGISTMIFTRKNIQELSMASTIINDSLYTFPPIEFDESKYHKVVIQSYDNGTPKIEMYYVLDGEGKPTSQIAHETHYYDNNQKYIEGNRDGDERVGLWYAYYPDGTVQTKGYYKNGKEHGQYTVFYSNGKVRYTGPYNQGAKVGEWLYYNEDGTLAHTEHY